MWDAKQYDRFAAERSRPFLDLIARVDATSPGRVVDLGCGTGAQTASLATRWTSARVVGVDSSRDMLDAAASHEQSGRISFELADLREWQPAAPVDVLLSNATLQWVPGHRELLPTLVSWLAPGGWLAFQVPNNFLAPAHRLLTELRHSPCWRELLGEDLDRQFAVAEPADYLNTLAELGCRVDVWETTYLHVLDGDDAVLEWMKGTGLRPVLARLDEAQRAEFLPEYAELLRTNFPQQPWGTVLPFRRIFTVAQKPA